MKKFAPLFMAGFLILVGAGCAGSTTTDTTVVTPPAQNPTIDTNGRAVFMIKDATSTVQNVTAVVLTVDKVEVHSTSSGWVTVSSAVKQYDLVQLRDTGAAKLLADINLAAGTYDQIRLNISKVMVTASGKTQTAKLPSNTLKIVNQLTITAGQTAVATLDFELAKSLHLTGDGKYILAPVVKLQTTGDAEVRIEADERVEVRGGRVENEKSVGMDEQGDVEADFVLPEKLKIDSRGVIEIERD